MTDQTGNQDTRKIAPASKPSPASTTPSATADGGAANELPATSDEASVSFGRNYVKSNSLDSSQHSEKQLLGSGIQRQPRSRCDILAAHYILADDVATANDVLLRVECISTREHRCVQAGSLVAAALAVALLIWESVIKVNAAPTDWITPRGLGYEVDLIHIIVYAIILGTLLVLGGLYCSKFAHVKLQGKHWSKRRLRLTNMAFIHVVVQCARLALAIAANAYLIKHGPCSLNAIPAVHIYFWYSLLVEVTTFLMLVSAHNTNLWTCAAAARYCKDDSTKLPIVLDAPWTIHTPKILFSLVGFVNVLVLMLQILRKEGPIRAKLNVGIAGTSTSCADVLLTTMFDPSGGLPGYYRTYNIVWSVLYVAIFSWFLYYLARGYYQWMDVANNRIGIMLLQLEVQTQTWHFCIVVALQVTRLVHFDSLSTLYLTACGFVAFEVAMGAMVVAQCIYYMPKDPEGDLVVPAWLQDVAVSEESKALKLQERAVHFTAHRATSKLKEPMFCYETALKLLYWTRLSYKIGKGHFGGVNQDSVSHVVVENNADRLILNFTLDRDCLPTHSSSGTLSRLNSGRWFVKPDASTGSSRYSQDSMDAIINMTATTLAGDPDDAGFDLEAPDTPTVQRHRRNSLTPEMPMTFEDTLYAAGSDCAVNATTGVGTSEGGAMGLFGFTDLQLFYERSAHTKSVVAWNHDTVLLAFRGTASLSNAWADLKAWCSCHKPERGSLLLGTCPLVHHGFYRLWLANGLNERVMDLLTQLIEDGTLQPSVTRVVLTGHSLGGALAQLAAFDIQKKFKFGNMQVYTFGSPQPGNRAFAAEYKALIPDSWNVINNRDPVPQTPNFFAVYKQPSKVTVIDASGNVVVRPSALETSTRFSGRAFGQHLLGSYATSMVAFANNQYTSKEVLGGRADIDAIAAYAPMRMFLEHHGFMAEKVAATPPSGWPVTERLKRHAVSFVERIGEWSGEVLTPRTSCSDARDTSKGSPGQGSQGAGSNRASREAPNVAISATSFAMPSTITAEGFTEAQLALRRDLYGESQDLPALQP